MSETTTENQSERLIVKNFGPLKDVDIELKDIMVFIGPQASGKSTLAKILYLTFTGIPFMPMLGYKKNYKKFFSEVSINFFSKKTLIKVKLKNSKVTFDNKNVSAKSNNKEALEALKAVSPSFDNMLAAALENNHSFLDNNTLKQDILEFALDRFVTTQYVFIPAERTLISALSDSLMGIISKNRNINFPKFIFDFGNRFETARKNLKNVMIDFLNIKYTHDGASGNFIHHKKNKEIVSLAEASTGIQSILPLYVVLKYLSQQEKIETIIIEEPELNLFPETQKKLVEFIIETCRDKTKTLIITTHSPYILTTLNGLIQAHNTARTKPELKDKVAEIIPENRWIDFDKIGVYHVADGTVKKIMDEENRLIDENAIDEVSENLGRIFGDLLELEFHEK